MSSKKEDLDMHDSLRTRLQNEISYARGSLEMDDVNWFFRDSGLGANLVNQNAKSPSASTPSKNPSPASTIAPTGTPIKQDASSSSSSVSTSAASSAVPKTVPGASSTKNSTEKSQLEGSVPLARSRTADARLGSNHDDFDQGTPLKRTATQTSGFNINAQPHRSSVSERRYSVGSVLSNSSVGSDTSTNTTKKKGFFKKMFGGKKSESTPPSSADPSQVSLPPTGKHTSPIPESPKVAPTQTTSSSAPLVKLSKQDSDWSKYSLSDTDSAFSSSGYSNNKNVDSKLGDSFTPRSSQDTRYSDDAVKKTYLNGVDISEMDPKLHQYLKDMDLSDIKFTRKVSSSSLATMDASTTNSSQASLGTLSSSNPSVTHYDKDTIPSHQDKPKLPSAFSPHPRFASDPTHVTVHPVKPEPKKEESGLFGSFLKRTKTNQNQPSSPSVNLSASSMTSNLDEFGSSFKYVKPPPRKVKEPPIPILRDMAPLRKVAFATTTFVNDPPQQIPSRHPRKGNVEIGENNELIIHKINPEELLNHASGIVVGGSGSLRLVKERDAESEGSAATSTSDDKEKAQGEEPTSQSMTKDSSKSGSMDKTINNKDRAEAALNARIPMSELTDEQRNERMKNVKDGIKIDKPMVKRRTRMEKPLVTLKIDELYTRCCHLREILPIPAILKQIPKGSTDPLQMIQLKNPRPSMIEILSFSDFIRVAPISCISFDGINLTVEMFRILLGSLLHKRYLEKLSLRNTPIDHEGWKVLCWFVTMNKSLRRLDITQCPSLAVATQKMKANKQRPDDHLIMKCNPENRSEMDWSLLTASLVARGGIEELILTGCKIPDSTVFQSLLNFGLSRKMLKIGLAYNDLTYNRLEVVSKWLSTHDEIIGIDLGYNDLSSSLKTLIQYAKVTPDAQLGLISLNSCNLQDNSEIEELFSLFSRLPNLKYLDLSNNKKLFPSFVTKMTFYLPLFNKLSRLNLDNNDLPTTAIISLAETLAILRSLTFLSIKGNKLNDIACNALVKGIKRCPTLFTLDFDKDSTTRAFQEKIGLLTIRNMERALYLQNDQTKAHEKKIHLKFTEGASEFKSQMSKIGFEKPFHEVMTDLLKDTSSIDPEKIEKFFSQSKLLLNSLHQSINELMTLQTKNQLSFEGKEALVRLCVIDSSIETGLQLINSKIGPQLKSVASSGTKLVRHLVNFEGVGVLAPESSDSTFTSISKESNNSNGSSTSLDDSTFGELSNNDTIELNDNEGYDSVPLSKSNSAASLNLTKEEAAAFKMGISLKDQLSQKLSQKGIEATPQNIREYLLESEDVGEFVDVVASLKKQGIDLTDLYKKQDQSLPVNEHNDDEDDDEDNANKANIIRKEVATIDLNEEEDAILQKTWDNTMMNRRSETVESEMEVPSKTSDRTEHSADIRDELTEKEYDKLLEQFKKLNPAS